MRYVFRAALAASAILLSAPAFAQVEEVVVTGSRMYEGPNAPNVTIVKRADHLITTLRITCDTRDDDQRREEIKTTLRGMMRAAAASRTISLGQGDGVLVPLEESAFDDMIEPDSRPDTSRLYVVIKTTISADDTFATATRRIKDFIAAVPRAGRVEVLRDDRWDLTLIGPEQYREVLIRKIVEDASRTAALFGASDGAAIDGLERPVAWYQKGPLDLALYIPYSLRIVPK
ncbi:MAG TPA: hypothetical protein VMH86_16355 [Rhizomicrobium sp.]|nr:hypothetical protein [Rhizomicrobium sp.]